jgi:hypothetical protein
MKPILGVFSALTLGASLFWLGAGVGMPSDAATGQPPGLRGYEGQPGNQGGSNHNGSSGQPKGLLGYEGQPGNQGGPNHYGH